MNCKRMEELILTDYVDGNLKGEALLEVEAHLTSCEKCRKLADEAASVGKVFKTVKREEPPPGVWYKIRAEIGSECEQPVLTRRFLDPARYFFTRLKPAVAVAAAAVLILFILTATQLMPNKSVVSNGTAQDDILAASYLDEGWDEPGYDFGTSLEQYFL